MPQPATAEYSVFQFKDFAGTSNVTDLIWNGQSNIPCSTSAVYLQVYNQNTNIWETIAFNNSAEADTDFDLTAHIGDLTAYKDAGNFISCRVYQLAQ